MSKPAISPIPNFIAPRIRANQIKLLEQLSNANGVSGDEGAVRKIILERIQEIVDEYRIDSLGNLLALKHGKNKNSPKVMLSAHMDEVGFIITYDDGKGIFRFGVVGGIDPRQLAGKQVLVGTDRIPGVIGLNPVHLTSDTEAQRVIAIDNLRIDVSPANASKVQIGERAIFATKFVRIGQSLLGKALDDRLGVVSLITLLENAPANITIQAAFTVQEESGLRGARVAAYNFNPDMAFALDCTPSLEQPVWDGSENTLYRSKTDSGPAIYVGDGATLSDPRLVSLLKETGNVYNIPYQIRQPGGGGTDAGAIHLQRAGIPSVSVSVPGRYLHSAVSLVRWKDWQNSLALLSAALHHINKNTLEIPR